MSPKASLNRRHLFVGASALVTLAACGETKPGAGKGIELLNVSYDPTRELYEAYNPLFVKHWKETKGQDVTIRQSHGGSGKQARSVIDGIEADVVTLALAADIDSIAERGKQIAPDWESKLPNHAAPYTSTIVFLVRKGNPKAIKSWEDLIKPGVAVITPNPKTSGGARWNYLAAYGWALKTFGQDQTKAQDYLKKLFANVPVLDTGARGSTVTFVERGVGDVLLAWENEAFLAVNKLGKGEFEIVVPPVSILAEPPVAVVDKIVARKGTAEVAKAYLEYLYAKPAQEIIAQNYYRPIDAETAAKYASTFPKTDLITVRDLGGWKKVQAEHFDEGGIFDKVGPAAKKA